MYHLIAVLLLSVAWWPIFAAAPSAVRVSSADSKVLGLAGDYEADGETVNGGPRYTRIAGVPQATPNSGASPAAAATAAAAAAAAASSAPASYLFRSDAGRWAFASEVADVMASKRLKAMSSGHSASDVSAASPVGLQYKYLDSGTFSWRLDPSFTVQDVSATMAARRSRSAARSADLEREKASAARRLEAEKGKALAEEAARRKAASAKAASAAAAEAAERAAQRAKAADAEEEAADVVAVVENLRREREEKVGRIQAEHARRKTEKLRREAEVAATEREAAEAALKRMVMEREAVERARMEAERKAEAAAQAAAAEAAAEAEAEEARMKLADADAELHALEKARTLLGEAAELEVLMREKTRQAMEAAEVAQNLATKRHAAADQLLAAATRAKKAVDSITFEL